MLFTRDLYLWHKNLPENFNERSYSDPQKIMAAIQKYSTEPGFSNPVDRWSFAMKKTEWNKISSGIAGDFGFGVLYRTEDDLRVKYVEAASPAGTAGIRRGWRITKINGNSNINYSNKDFVSNAVFNSSSSSFTFETPEGATKDISINAATYQEHPIFVDSMYTIGSKKIGYMVFNSFLGDTSRVYRQFNQIFSGFAQQNVTDVVIDLRYNGGGYVSMQEKMANYLVKPSANGDVMMKQEFNENLSEYNETTRFRKIGSLNLDRIIFIVSNGTASASELLINNLKPYMDVKVFGPSNTHGKPVGFFPYPVSDWYIFPVSFRTVNKSGQGNYFNGIELTSKTADGVDKDWGDMNEASLAGALKYIVSGSFRINSNNSYNENPVVRQANIDLDAHAFKGAINTRRMH
jgi:C-terminal processing protease CtpA/Prc